MAHEDEYAAGVMSGGNMRKLGMHKKSASKSKALHKAKEESNSEYRKKGGFNKLLMNTEGKYSGYKHKQD